MLSIFTNIGKFLIEFLKGEVLMFWIVEASDDVAGKLLWYELFKSQGGHSRFEDFPVVFVSEVQSEERAETVLPTALLCLPASPPS